MNRNSTEARPEAFGDSKPVDFGKVDKDVLAGLGDSYVEAEQAAQIALRGVAAGAFIIPTHAFQREDVDARYREMIAGFDLLNATLGSSTRSE